MKKNIFLALVALSLSVNVIADDFRAPFLDQSLTEDPSYGIWIPDPPKLTSGAFSDDFYYYQWGLEQRTVTGVADIAIYDESAPLEEVFGEVMQIPLSRETTPEIMLLCERATADAHEANKMLKNKYQRIRPFATFKDESLIPETDEEEAATFSYPSGHSSRGYMFALVLGALDPAMAPLLMKRATLYAQNRVICGHHWKSDIEASLLLTAGVFSMVVGTEGFQEQFKKARAEYEQIKASTRMDAPRSATASGSATIYDMQGRRLNAEPKKGMYIQDGQKHVNKWD